MEWRRQGDVGHWSGRRFNPHGNRLEQRVVSGRGNLIHLSSRGGQPAYNVLAVLHRASIFGVMCAKLDGKIKAAQVEAERRHDHQGDQACGNRSFPVFCSPQSNLLILPVAATDFLPTLYHAFPGRQAVPIRVILFARENRRNRENRKNRRNRKDWETFKECRFPRFCCVRRIHAIHKSLFPAPQRFARDRRDREATDVFEPNPARTRNLRPPLESSGMDADIELIRSDRMPHASQETFQDNAVLGDLMRVETS